MDCTNCMRDWQRKGIEYVGSGPKSNDYKIASIVVVREISEHILSASHRERRVRCRGEI